MNPTPTTGSYTAGTISASNSWSFINAYSGSTYNLLKYGYRQNY